MIENTQNLPPEIKERFLELPKSVQDIILNSGWEKTIRRIVKNHNLRVDQGSLIEMEVMLIMFGFINPADFLSDIIDDANVDPKIAKKIEIEVGEKIFKLIKDQIRNIETEDTFEDKQNNNTAEKPTQTTKSSENKIIESRLEQGEVEKPKKIDPYLEPVE